MGYPVLICLRACALTTVLILGVSISGNCAAFEWIVRLSCRMAGLPLRPAFNKLKAILADGFFCLMPAVPYSHMGRPHTTIGATAFHF